MKNFSVKARLAGLLSALVCALFVVGALGVLQLREARQQLSSVLNDDLRSTQWLGQMMAYSRDNVLALDELLLTGTAEAVTVYKQKATDNKKRIDALWEQYQQTDLSAEEKQIGEDYQAKRSVYRDTRNAIADAVAAGQLDAARTRRTSELQPYISAMLTAGQQLVDLQTKSAEATRNAALKSYYRSLWLISGVGMLAIAITLWMGWQLTRFMLDSLQQAIDLSERIASGELGHRVSQSGDDEFGRLLQALHRMDNKLCEIVGAVSDTADSVGSAARQIAQGNDDLSSRTQEQASALQQTAATMEEMTATVKRNSDNTSQADQLGRKTRSQADTSSEVVQKAVAAMAEINTSSKRISDIINVIDEIAFQTNLLALNAAVEAARAGEQGRGFAVVANEVRNLAQRSASAAKEIKMLINDSVGKVRAGTDLVNASGKALNDIVMDVKHVTDIVAEIAAASTEQAHAIDQINHAVTQMDATTQQNAALVEEAASASKAMEQQSQDLVERVSFFRIEGQVQHARQRISHYSQSGRTAAPAAASHNTPAAAPAAFKRAAGDDSSWTEF